MENTVSIRLANAGDLPAAYALICEMQSKELDLGEFGRIFNHHLTHKDVKIWVATSGSSVLGIICLEYHYQLHHAGKVAEIVELAVNPEFRSKGIGHQLLKTAEADSQENGCQILELSTNMRRARAHEFYEREGMVPSHYKFTKEL